MLEYTQKTIAVIGGSGALGSALGLRWLLAGHQILIGSRSQERAESAANDLSNQSGRDGVVGYVNERAAALADIVVLTVPYSAHQETLHEIVSSVQNKIVIETTVPLQPPKVARVSLPQNGSVGAITQSFFGESAQVVSALHTVSAAHLSNLDNDLSGDVLVYGNQKEPRQIVIDLIKEIGLKGWHAGSIDNSAASEAMTSVLIFMNKHYGFDGAGIKIISEGQKASS